MTQIQIQIRYKWAKQAVWVRHPAQGNCVAHGHGDGNMLEMQKKSKIEYIHGICQKIYTTGFSG